jgi:hypothetical protein
VNKEKREVKQRRIGKKTKARVDEVTVEKPEAQMKKCGEMKV